MILTIIWCAILSFLGILFLLVLFVMLGHICTFHLHKCPHCNHVMEYHGLREDDKEGHFLFHCEKCGAWQQIPKKEFLRGDK